MSNTTFQELKNHVRISDVAEHIGYRLNTGAGKKYLEYRLFNGNTKVDEIVIYTTSYSQTFFSRNGYGDKGDVVNFILNRLHLFSGYQGIGYDAVADILCKLSGKQPKHENYVVSHNEVKFSLDDYDITCNQKVIYAYLGKIRMIDANTISAFIHNGSVCTVSRKPKNYANVAFPYRVLASPEEVVNFELRNYNPYKKEGYKGFCSGGNKSTACWIASFAPQWNDVQSLYIGESALDMMALYQLLPERMRINAAFISLGGNLGYGQIKDVRKLFSNAAIYLAFDNDLQGQLYDIEAAYFLITGKEPKIFRNASGQVVVKLDNQELVMSESDFNSKLFLHTHGIEADWLRIIKAKGAKDFNDMLKKH